MIIFCLCGGGDGGEGGGVLMVCHCVSSELIVAAWPWVGRVPCFVSEAYKHTRWTRLLQSPCLFPVSVCLSSGALLSFLVISHLPLSVSQPYIFFLFIVSFSVHPFFFVCFSSRPPFFLSSVLCAFSPDLFKSNFSLYLVKRHMFFFTYSRPFVLLHQQSIGPYKEMIQRTQTASEKCLADDLLQCLPLYLFPGFIWPAHSKPPQPESAFAAFVDCCGVVLNICT